MSDQTTPLTQTADVVRSGGLLPCPFCGGPARSIFVTGMCFHFWCGCDVCQVYTQRKARDDLGNRDTEREQAAIGAWNKRAIDAGREQQLFHALQITSGWLTTLAAKFKLDEHATRATIRHEGKVIAETSLGQALDIANAALEPEPKPPEQS
jgi:hypothetical protein